MQVCERIDICRLWRITEFAGGTLQALKTKPYRADSGQFLGKQVSEQQTVELAVAAVSTCDIRSTIVRNFFGIAVESANFHAAQRTLTKVDEQCRREKRV
jgi:hypothetical protein